MTNPTSPPVTAEQIECSCADVAGENPDCALHGVSVEIWAGWSDDQCMMEPDIDSHTVRRKCQQHLAMLKAHKPAVVGVTVIGGPCEHQWAHAPTVGYFSCMRCREHVNYDDPRYAELLAERNIPTPVGDEVVERLKRIICEIENASGAHPQRFVELRAAINSLGLGIGQ